MVILIMCKFLLVFAYSALSEVSDLVQNDHFPISAAIFRYHSNGKSQTRGPHSPDTVDLECQDQPRIICEDHIPIVTH